MRQLRELKGAKLMTVYDFTKYDVGSTMFKLVDATKPGYMTRPDENELMTGDKNAVRVRYGRMEVLHFEVTGKKKMTLYVR